MSHSRAQRGPKALFMFFFFCELLQLLIVSGCSRSIATAATAHAERRPAITAAADMLGDDEQQQPIPGADPAGSIAVEEATRDRAVRQRDESNAQTANKREYDPQNCNGET